MKKALLSVFVAVVLGVGLMLFPYWTFFKIYGENPIESTGSLPYLKPMTASENWANYSRQRTEGLPTYEGTYNVQSKPADASLQMLTIGFIVALVVYVFVRRKSSRPTYLPSVRFPQY